MNLEFIEARDLPDAWFQCIDRILESGNKYTIDRGSYEGQQRLEFDYITVHIKYPGVRPLLPDIPPHLGIPNPVADGYLEEYLPYLMTSTKKEGEDYTYGERLTAGAILYDQQLYAPHDVYGGEVDQIQVVIDTYKKYGHRNNQMILQIGQPSDILLEDPPCLRSIDTRISDGKLHFVVYFRSWDLYSGFPANLGAIQMLKEYMSAEIGVEDGEIIASSKGLHLYDYAWELAKLRANK
jgi:thymidylate synthase